MDNIKISKFVDGLNLDKNRKKLLITFIEELIKESTESDYKIPLASNNIRGGIKSGYPQNGKNYPVQINAQEQAYVSVPWTDNNTTYAAATTSVLGLVKQGAAVENLPSGATIDVIVGRFNDLLTKLKNASIIANAVDKIPPEIKDALVAWYSPYCKQRMTNHDVIESYTEDFTSNNWKHTNNVTVTSNSFRLTYGNLTYELYPIKDYNTKPMTVIVKGLVGIEGFIRYIYGRKDYIDISTDGVYYLPAKVDDVTVLGFQTHFKSECDITITQLPTSILKDFSGNKHDAYLYGFKGKLNSGVGSYKVDFSKSQNANAFDNFERFNNKFVAKGRYNGNWSVFGQYTVDGIVKNKVTIKITGVSNISYKLDLQYGYITKDGKYIQKEIFISKDGIYSYDINNVEIPDENNIAQTVYNRFYFDKEVINDVNLIVEEIPDYPNQLCYDGKSYAVAYDMPILTDYTIIADRTWFVDKQERVFISKATGQNGAFIFECKTSADNKTYSYYQQNDIVIDNNNKVVYQTKNSYNGTTIQAGDKQDTDVLYIGNVRVPDSRSFIGCHGDILLFNRTLTDDELSVIKEVVFGISNIKDALLTVDKKYIKLNDNNYIKLNK
jgi:hypothetical protein